MERRIQVFIADASQDFIALLCAKIEQQQDLTVVDTATAGNVAYEKLLQSTPDVLVTDLLLPGLDGLSLLRALKQEGKLPRTVVVSGFVNDRIAQAVSRLGVEDYLPKPCGLEELTCRIREAASPERRRAVRNFDPVISEALLNFGIMPHLNGYQFLREGVRRALDDRNVLRGITKILYPDLAKQFNTTSHCVERSIRGAIEKAWVDGNRERRQRYFGGVFDSFSQTPTNIRFITAIVEFIEMGYDKLDIWES
ncbi:MAG: response regulator [Oscillospiraceae bacterium]|nr:response regulator [Oscillospiraceae bacterium]MCD8390200.1 response regulator [Oscillospiraceae bacterium]